MSSRNMPMCTLQPQNDTGMEKDIDWNNLLTLGKILRQKRKSAKLSVRSVAAACKKLSFSHLASIERGRIARPKVDILNFLINFYGLDGDEVMRLAGRIPDDIYWKLVRSPKLVKLLRTFQE